MSTIEFRNSDAWILLSIPFDNIGTDLAGIFSRADAINHAAPAKYEVGGALARGMKAGIIECVDGKYRYANRYRSTFHEVCTRSNSVFRSMENLRQYLTENQWLEI